MDPRESQKENEFISCTWGAQRWPVWDESAKRDWQKCWNHFCARDKGDKESLSRWWEEIPSDSNAELIALEEKFTKSRRWQCLSDPEKKNPMIKVHHAAFEEGYRCRIWWRYFNRKSMFDLPDLRLAIKTVMVPQRKLRTAIRNLVSKAATWRYPKNWFEEYRGCQFGGWFYNGEGFGYLFENGSL